MPLTMRPLWQFGSICGTPHTDRPADTGRDDETRNEDGTCGMGVVATVVVVVAVEVVVVVVVVVVPVVVDDEVVVGAGVVARPDILTQGLVGRSR